MDSLKWEKIAKRYALGHIAARPYHKRSKLFIKNNKFCMIYILIVTTKFDEICCSESFTSLPPPWEINQDNKCMDPFKM